MIGINDSPALSAANVGIAISDGAEIAREIADITVGSDDLYQIVTLKYISNALMKRIKSNYRKIVGFNSGLIALWCGRCASADYDSTFAQWIDNSYQCEQYEESA